MKAIIATKYGSPDVLELKEIDKPTPRDKEVLVKVYATCINDWDWGALRGTPFVNRIIFGILKPKKILGCDIAGKVEAVGRNATRFKPGDEVFGDLSSSGFGGFAEYVCTRENALIPKPASLTFDEAAAVPQAGALAQQGIFYNGEIQHGQKILINGAGGGVGSFAIPMAKFFGAHVTGVDSTRKLDMMRSLGADEVIDYTKEDFTKNGKQYDLIIDNKAYHSIFDYRRALSSKGAYAMLGGGTSTMMQGFILAPLISMFGNKKIGVLMLKANKGLDYLKKLFDEGRLKPVIDKRYPLSETAEAFRYYGKGLVQGKIVITVEHNNNT